jgi:hypothetical protein
VRFTADLAADDLTSHIVASFGLLSHAVAGDRATGVLDGACHTGRDDRAGDDGAQTTAPETTEPDMAGPGGDQTVMLSSNRCEGASMRSAVSWPFGMALVPVIWAVPLY